MSRFQNCYNETLFKYAMRILKYLYKTKDYKLAYYRKCDTEIVDCYVDADWAGDVVDRKSTSGFVVRVFGNAILWRSHKQNSVTKSSTFAEYIALSEAVTEVNHVRVLLEIFNIELKEPI